MFACFVERWSEARSLIVQEVECRHDYGEAQERADVRWSEGVAILER